MSATYTKLKSGEWGIRVTGGAVSEGQAVTVTKRDGTTKTETVRRVLYRGDGFTLCQVAAAAPAKSYAPRAGRRRPSRVGSCWECGGYGPLDQDGMCGRC